MAMSELIQKLRNAYALPESSPEQQVREKNPPASKTIYGEVQPGDWVIAAGNNDYQYLIGTVTVIDKSGTPEHGTENTTDDIHVDFTAFDYPPERVAEIEGYFGELYSEAKAFDELPLDDVIMAPQMLIRITHLGQDEIARLGNLRHNCESFCNCFPGGGEPQNGKHAELITRLNQNFCDFHDSLSNFSKQELIDMAQKISSVSDAHGYMTTYREYKDEELDYYLKFQNPLEIVADAWQARNEDVCDVYYTVAAIVEQREQNPMENYSPLAGNATSNDMPPELVKPSVTSKQAIDKPKTLAEKMQTANEMVKAQDMQGRSEKPPNREERT